MADFILGRLKFHFKGDWVTGTAYIKDDVVRYGGNSFVAMANHTGSATFEADLSSNKWKKMSAGEPGPSLLSSRQGPRTRHECLKARWRIKLWFIRLTK